MEDCWSEFGAIVKAQVCDDNKNVSYCNTPSDPLLRDSQPHLCTPTPPVCCSVASLVVQDLSPAGPCGGQMIKSAIDCDPAWNVDIQWLYSPTGSTYTSLGSYSMGFVSGGPIAIYGYSNNDIVNGTNWFAANGTGFYKVILTGTLPGAAMTVCTTACTSGGSATCVFKAGGLTVISSQAFNHSSLADEKVTVNAVADKTTANGAIQLVIGTAALTAGVIEIYVTYYQSDISA